MLYEHSKKLIKCPLCGAEAKTHMNISYLCYCCGWDSMVNTVDISYKDELSGPLSNLFPHKFIFYTSSETDKTYCLSMESFIQSLRVKDPICQKYICENYAGYIAWKLKFALPDWRKDGIVYWNGKPIVRESDEYTNLITRAYDRLYASNPVFRELVLPKFKGKILIHSIGGDSKSQTLLTEEEFCSQLNRLMKKLP